MTELGNKIINLRALDVQTLGHYCILFSSKLQIQQTIYIVCMQGLFSL